MNAHSFLVNSDVGGLGVHPRARVVVVDAVTLLLHGIVRVPTENAVGLMKAGVVERARRHFRRQPQPTRVQPVNHSSDGLVLEIQLLYLEVATASLNDLDACC
jgi:hypothetical protein